MVAIVSVEDAMRLVSAMRHAARVCEREGAMMSELRLPDHPRSAANETEGRR